MCSSKECCAATFSTHTHTKNRTFPRLWAVNVWPNICWLVIFDSRIVRICQRNRRMGKKKRNRDSSHIEHIYLSIYLSKHEKYPFSTDWHISHTVCDEYWAWAEQKKIGFAVRVNERKIYKNNGNIGQDNFQTRNLRNHGEIEWKILWCACDFVIFSIKNKCERRQIRWDGVIWRTNRIHVRRIIMKISHLFRWCRRRCHFHFHFKRTTHRESSYLFIYGSFKYQWWNYINPLETCCDQQKCQMIRCQ